MTIYFRHYKSFRRELDSWDIPREVRMGLSVMFCCGNQNMVTIELIGRLFKTYIHQIREDRCCKSVDLPGATDNRKH